MEKTISNSTNDDSTKHSTQDRHDHDIFKSSQEKKIKEPLNDFDSSENNDDDNKIYEEKVWKLTDKIKVNYTATISLIRAELKSRLLVHLCRMVPMPIVRHALKGDITKLEVDFFNGYRDGDRVFYISATDFKGHFQFVNDEVRASWSADLTQANAVFESSIRFRPGIYTIQE